MIYREHRKSHRLSFFERIYIALFGYPALGLHVRLKAIIPLLKLVDSPSKILDAGCGNGVFTFTLARLFDNSKVLGIDIENELIKNNRVIAERLKLHNCEFVCMDVFNISPDSNFDLIVSTDNLEHLENDRDLLALFNRVLRSEGHLILHVPHITRPVFWWKRQNFIEIEGHVRPGYAKKQIEKMLQETGFTVQMLKYNFNSFETFFNDISFLVTKGREENKVMYAMVFPILLLLTKLFSWWPVGTGSGIVIQARKSV
jgi:ubiquinone/menaquinone biosynthesis C-methylase UbiE